jgi:hypothetical protein
MNFALGTRHMYTLRAFGGWLRTDVNSFSSQTLKIMHSKIISELKLLVLLCGLVIKERNWVTIVAGSILFHKKGLTKKITDC